MEKCNCKCHRGEHPHINCIDCFSIPKPSERIKEIEIQLLDKYGEPNRRFAAIIAYLDEQHEKELFN